MGQRAAVEQAGVAYLKHLVAVLGVDVLAAGGRAVAGVIITGVGLVGVRQRVADLQVHQRVVQRLVVVLAGPGGVDQLAVGQQPVHGRLQAAVAINRPLARHQKGYGAKGAAQVQLAAAVGQAKAVFGARVEVALEQHRILILRGVGVALGVQVAFALIDVSGQFDVIAVAVIEVQQAVEQAIVGAAEQGAGIAALLVVALIAVLHKGAAVAARLEHVGGIAGFHVHGTAKAAVTGERRVGALLHFNAFDQLGLDKDGALLIALKAALAGTIQGEGYVLGVAQAPDIHRLPTRLGRATHGHTRQGLQQAGDVVGLLALDLATAQG